MQTDVASYLLKYHEFQKNIHHIQKQWQITDFQVEPARAPEAIGEGRYFFAPWVFEFNTSKPRKLTRIAPLWIEIEVLADHTVLPVSDYPWPLIPYDLLEPTVQESALVMSSHAAVETFFQLHPLKPKHSYPFSAIYDYSKKLYEFLTETVAGKPFFACDEFTLKSAFLSCKELVLPLCSRLQEYAELPKTPKSENKDPDNKDNDYYGLFPEYQHLKWKDLCQPTLIEQTRTDGHHVLLSALTHQWVLAALSGGKPNTIAAVVSSEPAIEKLLTALHTLFNEEDAACKRWLPMLNGLGVYLCQDKDDEKRFTPCIKRRRKQFEALYTRESLEEAKTAVLENASRVFKSSIETLEEAQHQLEQRLHALLNEFKSGQSAFDGIEQVHLTLDEEYLRHGGFQPRFERLSIEAQAAKTEYLKIRQLHDAWCQHVARLPWYLHYFSWLPGLKSKREALDKMFLMGSYAAGIEVGNNPSLAIPKLLQQAHQKNTALHKSLEKLETEWQRLDLALNTFSDWCKAHGATQVGLDAQIFNQFLTNHFRKPMFYTAVHLFECRWLMAELQKQNDETALLSHPDETALLTPCWVGTPAAFAKLNLDHTFDCLYVAEADSLTPEEGMALSTLAQKQVALHFPHEGHWVSQFLSIRNTVLRPQSPSSVEDDLEDEDHLDDDPQSLVHTYTQYLFTVPHRVVVVSGMSISISDAIASLAGTLMQSDPPNGKVLSMHHPWQALNLIPVVGRSEKVQGSFIRIAEIDAILQFLHEEMSKIQARYPTLAVADAIAILTPFSAQKFELQKALKMRGFEMISVFTFQEALHVERKLVLVSLTVTTEDSRPFLFDRFPGLLASALFSAQDSIVFFADKDIFKTHARTPSGLLAEALETRTKPVLELEKIAALL